MPRALTTALTLVLAVLGAVVLGWIAFYPTVYPVSWYQAHPLDRARMNLLCSDNPGQAMHDANCQNAEAALMHSEIERLFASMPK